jgi:hypothetical protein
MLKRLTNVILGVLLVLLIGGVFLLTTKVNNLASLLTATPPATTSTKSPTTSLSIGECSGSGYCLRFKHEAELALPAVSSTGCAPYKLPEMPALPNVKELDISATTSSEQASDTLLKYVEKVLDADKANQALLLKHYQDYLAGCSEAAKPSTPTN